MLQRQLGTPLTHAAHQTTRVVRHTKSHWRGSRHEPLSVDPTMGAAALGMGGRVHVGAQASPTTRFLGAPAPTRRGGRGAPVLEPAPVDVRRRRDALLPASGRPGGRRGWATNTASVGVWRTPAALWRVPGAQLPGYNGGRLPDTRWRPTRQQNWVSLHNGSWASLCLCRPRSAHFSARQRLCPLGVWTTTEAATISGGRSTPPASGFSYDPRGTRAYPAEFLSTNSFKLRTQQRGVPLTTTTVHRRVWSFQR